MEAAFHHGVSNLVCVLDLNRLGQRGPTMHGWDADVFVTRAEAYGWHALSIDGHDVEAIDAAYREAEEQDRPTMIVARTEKGHGVSVDRRPRGLARQGPPARDGRTGDRRARRHPLPHHHAAQARTVDAGRGRFAARRAGPRLHRADRDTEGVRRDRWHGSRANATASSSSTARSGTPRTPRTSRRSHRNASSRCTSPNRRSSVRRRACRHSARPRSRRRSGRS